MHTLQLIAVIFAITAIGGQFNKKYLCLPTSIGVLLFSISISLILLLLGSWQIIDLSELSTALRRLDFSGLLLDGLLAILLFAGAIQINLRRLKIYSSLILLYSTVCVVVSALMTGYIVYVVLKTFTPLNMSFWHCALFGAIIAPTDPVAVVSILTKYRAPIDLKSQIAGESLFNDACAIVMFMSISNILFSGHGYQMDTLAIELILDIAGGLATGLTCCAVAWWFIKDVDSHEIELMLTIALALGSYAMAQQLGVCAPLAVVIAGLFIGNHAKDKLMSHKTKSIVAIFWSLVDDIFNAALFVVIGLELILIKFSHSLILGGVIAIIASLVARHCSLLCINVAWLVARARQAMKYSLPRLRNQLMQSLVTYPFLMTWGGLRGGISIALALSLPNSFMHKESFLAFTFMVVIFSIVIQGTTFCSLLNLMKNYLKKFPRDH